MFSVGLRHQWNSFKHVFSTEFDTAIAWFHPLNIWISTFMLAYVSSTVSVDAWLDQRLAFHDLDWTELEKTWITPQHSEVTLGGLGFWWIYDLVTRQHFWTSWPPLPFSVAHSAAWQWSVFIPYEVRIGAAPTYALNYKASCFANSPWGQSPGFAFTYVYEIPGILYES